jgi:Flp pilus assembly pilin Flp
MLRVFAFLQNFLAEPVRRDDRGVTAVEYAILLTVVGIGLIATLTAFNTALRGLFAGFFQAF